MLVFRCLQGIGAALVMSCGAALVTSLYGEERRSRALGIYTMMMALGLMLGPLLGGALVAIWDWPAVFWFRIPIAIAALLLLRGLPASQPRRTSDRFDISGRHRTGAGPGDDADGVQPHPRVVRGLARIAVRCWPLPALSSASPARRGRSSSSRFSPAGICAAQPRQRAGQSRGLFGLAAGALLSGARARLFAGGERRHPGGGRGRRGAGGADRRPPDRAADLRRTAGHCRRRGHRRRPAAAGRMDRADADHPARRGTGRSGHRPRPVPARLYGYRDGGASPGGSRRCRQPRAADADAGHRRPRPRSS